MSKKCFFICPIGDEGSETRRVSDIVLKYIVSPVCNEFGYEVIRSDTEYTTNTINDDIFNHLDNDELAIADLTGNNPNVFYEAGYRKAKGLPLIHIAMEGTFLPFDIKTIRTYFYGIDVDKADNAKESLRKVIGNISDEKIISITPNKIDFEIQDVYKIKSDIDINGYDYLFKVNYVNQSKNTVFIKRISINNAENSVNVELDKLPVITKVNRTGKVETGRKVLYSQEMPFKIAGEDCGGGFFYLCDKNNTLDIQINNDIIMSVLIGDKMCNINYHVTSIKDWGDIEF